MLAHEEQEKGSSGSRAGRTHDHQRPLGKGAASTRTFVSLRQMMCNSDGCVGTIIGYSDVRSACRERSVRWDPVGGRGEGTGIGRAERRRV